MMLPIGSFLVECGLWTNKVRDICNMNTNFEDVRLQFSEMKSVIDICTPRWVYTADVQMT